ncbi:PTS system transporter subunit IIB [Listeria weihenstephanensis FSL R9-0317]|uniref:PTS lactose transporter subunit IIBC n=1 Tax=Listeria weihenstephanensis TaxID=1006155 RepID=A0A1S7FW25_9LIST|nr:PTS lactose transporter subunit IIBC [Listeria weihenstephanensis]AQY51628.1 PTS lactose transporter subunit IIBC [Listeria weihenstephanensis]EUJ34847.1 PTS system transporter subunit IIB [Listeria weihenstephanensis FSL R9-0317]MBC1501971.1 PTS sugar transporter subunit IIB [Listeria weihenstephanensis]
MKKLLIVCAGGATSSLMAQNVVKEAEKQGLTAKLLFPEDLTYNRVDQYADKDLVVIMGPIGMVVTTRLKGYSKVDAVLVSPQVKYLFKNAEKVLNELEIPCANIDSLAFGRMRGDIVLAQGLTLMKV